MTDPTPEAAVDRIFRALDKMTDSELLALSGVWVGGDAEVRKQAWTRIGAVSGDDARAESLEASRDRLATWVNDMGITWAGAYERSIVVPTGADQGNLRRNAVPPILDAIAATLFADLLTADESDELLAPLHHVTEPEPLDD